MSIEREEWMMKSRPGDFFANFGQKNKRRYKVRTLSDNNGWVILRTE